MPRLPRAILCATLVLTLPQMAFAETTSLRADQRAFLDTYRELIETDTSITTGDCTLAAGLMAERLRAAGVPDAAITPFGVPDHPKEGGLVVQWPGSDPDLKAILLLAHIDVVDAKRTDWERDPYTLTEEDGYFYGRGTFDDKAQASIWVDLLARLAQDNRHLKRPLKLALTCGEESSTAFNGAEWLVANRRDLIDAEYALNEGGGGYTNGTPLSAGGALVMQTMQVGEKMMQVYRLETTNPGGHSSMPVPDNAIYRLSKALLALEAHEFPVELNDTTRNFFETLGAAKGDEVGEAMSAVVRDPSDAAAIAVLDADPVYHATLRTTCVATMLEAGHANNALPQRATATINCRILPGQDAQEIRDQLVQVLDDPEVSVTIVPPVWKASPPPPLDPRILGTVKRIAADYFPGVPLVTTMTAGSTDAIFLTGAGIPTYGPPGPWINPDGNGIHGADERLEVSSLLTGRDYLYALVTELADQGEGRE